jgi:hypothetical protein
VPNSSEVHAQHFCRLRVCLFMKSRFLLCAVLTAAFASGVCLAQGTAAVVPVSDSPVVLDWTPPALAELSTMAAVKNSFTLDRTLLGAAASVLPDSEAPAKQAIGKLDGVSVHLLRFGPDGIPDEHAVDAIRDSYHLRGWKHVVTTSHGGGPIHNDVTDVWMVLDGVNVRGAVILAETPKSVTLVTIAGNLSTVDLLHLRGHFGIPKFDDGDAGPR